MSDIPKFWRDKLPLSFLLFPLSLIFGLIAEIRKKLLKPQKLPIPVLVVGNLTVGGNGKTPVVIALLDELKKRNLRAGVISRGYLGTKTKNELCLVDEKSSPQEVGDEPFLIFQKCNCPVAVGRNRYEAGKLLIKNFPNLDLIISDDGLQHYKLARDFEIAAISCDFLLGNNFLIPAGSLRESPKRLNSVDAILLTGAFKNEIPQVLKNFSAPKFISFSKAENFYFLKDKKTCSKEFLLNNPNLIAVAGIARPERFFKSLENLGIKVFKNIAISDHKEISQLLVDKYMNFSFIITEKDAVKIARDNPLFDKCIVLSLEALLPQDFLKLIVKKIKEENE